MKLFFLHPKIILGCRLILGAIFIYASIHKIYDPIGFSENIDHYNAIPLAFNNLIALIIPWLELVIGVFLIFGTFLHGASFLSTLLMFLFIILIAQALARGIDLHCGCFKIVADAGATNLRSDMIMRIIEDFILFGMALMVTYSVNIKEGTAKNEI